jgi:hypothetical protein
MSRALASARQRRAGPEPVPVPPPVSSNNGANGGVNGGANGGANGGLTLPQVIALIDTRLVTLEKFMKDSQEVPSSKSVSFSGSVNENSDEQGDDITQVLSEYESRFMLLAEEIAGLKDSLMKLQTYTMDVNKMLLEERVNVLSDLSEEKFIISDTAVSNNHVETFELSSTQQF